MALDQYLNEQEVALRKESVDRKVSGGVRSSCFAVALRKESVDRKVLVFQRFQNPISRSPQGERG